MSFWLAITSSLWLGILTSISPCPLATNIAAISYMSRGLKHSKHVLITGALYSIGRIISYSLLGTLIVFAGLSISTTSFFLQKYMYIALGPLLIVTGMFLLELIVINIPRNSFLTKLQDRLKNKGYLGALGLGIVFALAFCPISAALFFGGLIPLAIEYKSTMVLPSMFGLGTAIPVFAFSIVIVFAGKSISKLFNNIKTIEVWLRTATGVVIILVGIYLSLTYIFRLL